MHRNYNNIYIKKKITNLQRIFIFQLIVKKKKKKKKKKIKKKINNKKYFLKFLILNIFFNF